MVFEIIFNRYDCRWSIEWLRADVLSLELDLELNLAQMYTGDNGPSRITGKCDEICFVLQITTSDVILNHSPLYQIIAIGVI